jgi:hypothetical protein
MVSSFVQDSRYAVRTWVAQALPVRKIRAFFIVPAKAGATEIAVASAGSAFATQSFAEP